MIPIPPSGRLRIFGGVAVESHETTADGVPIFVRPIKPEDAPIFVDLFNTLSPTSGAKLLGKCLQIAKRRGMEKVFGAMLSENRHMPALARKLGFEMKREPVLFQHDQKSRGLLASLTVRLGVASYLCRQIATSMLY